MSSITVAASSIAKPNFIIDCHGHFTVLPKQVEDYRTEQKRRLGLDAAEIMNLAPLLMKNISDDEIREVIEANQLPQQRARGIDLTVFSPRASAMEHHVGDLQTSIDWTRNCNDLVARVAGLYPHEFAAACQLPQSPHAPLTASVEELTRCIDMGFVAFNLNPDPTGGHWNGARPLTDVKHWEPIYKAMSDLKVPAMIHVSGSCRPEVHATGDYYMEADTRAFMQFLQGPGKDQPDVFKEFSDAKFIIPHGGAAVPYHWGRYRGLGDMLKRPEEYAARLLDNNHVSFDTCVYHQPGIDLLLKVIPSKNILFGEERVGAVRGKNPDTGEYYDYTKLSVLRSAWAERDEKGMPTGKIVTPSAEDLRNVFELNTRRVYPLLDKRLVDMGLVEPMVA
jgi:4-oxalmesaconate hydratase